jgi:hypothetical protein
MNCRDVRDVGESFLGEELLTETNHEILRHLETCPSCRTEIEGRRRLRGALRTAVSRAADLQPPADLADRLRDRLRHEAADRQRSTTMFRRWFALAAALVLAAGVTASMVLKRSTAAVDALAQDAIGDHRNCALKFRLVRMPVPLEDAAVQFDSAYRLLLAAPPDDIATPNGPARVIERHSCVYGTRRFGHVVLEYRGRVVSLLVTANDGAPGGDVADAIPHVIGPPTDGLSVVSVNGSRHAILLVSDLGTTDLTELSKVVSLPLAQRLASVFPDRGAPTAVRIALPVQEVAVATWLAGPF